MLIDWFTVAAQALNFLILLWLMKRYLYAPILKAVDARELRIAAELKDAETKKSEAQKEREEFEHKNEVFDQQHAEMLTKATDEIATQGREMLKQAREKADNWAAKRQEALRTQADGLSRAIEDSARNEVLAITRKALHELATTDLESSIAEIFMQRLRALDADAKADLVGALKIASPAPTVSSAFTLSKQQQDAIQAMLEGSFSLATPLVFEVRPDLICGIELNANGQLVSWNVDGYLMSLKKEIGRIASEHVTQADSDKTSPDAKAEPAPALPSGSDTGTATETPAGEAPPPKANAA